MINPVCDYCRKPEPPNGFTGRPTHHPKDVESITCSTCIMALTGGGLRVRKKAREGERVRGGRVRRRRRR